VSKKKKRKSYEDEFQYLDNENRWRANSDYFCVCYFDYNHQIYRYRLEREDENTLIPHGPKTLTFDSKYMVQRAFSQLAKSLEKDNPQLSLHFIDEIEDF